ncbi:5-oxoprolinase subunit PxpB [Acetobacter sp. DsW_063]|uniref:5-oxoprolinase subunit PxpB n=1 Tax=Acetobacter sp. DsW_063 TaxID=1514894 RepID=UPI000A37A16F|nr:5-oxoprolinase subunit PxpB [Acetobacter sp. DsW_063]OUJ15980.1 allophanate hydrolase [Acetobacter sp. DsW_063]
MIRISCAGAGALLLDAAHGAFNDSVQERIWAVARRMAALPEILQAVPGVNNLLIVFDAVQYDPATLEHSLRAVWKDTLVDASPAREIVLPVTYGGTFGEDIPVVARFAGLTEEEVIAAHVSGEYRVAAIGAMPGFAYLTGLDPRLAIPRRASPRVSVEQGAVSIGGGQAGVMPCTSPTGWHILGKTEEILFDAHRPEPCLFRLGDRVKFRRVG